MQQDHLDIPPFVKVYSTKMIVISSFFGGVLASGFMIYKNFMVLGLLRKANLTVLITALALLLIGASDSIPSLEKIPVSLFSLFFTILAAFVTGKFQRSEIEKYISVGGSYYSAGIAIFICIISILILAALILAAFLLQDAAVLR